MSQINVRALHILQFGKMHVENVLSTVVDNPHVT